MLNLKLKAVLLAEGLKFGIANIKIKTSRGPEVLSKLEFHPSHETERKCKQDICVTVTGDRSPLATVTPGHYLP